MMYGLLFIATGLFSCQFLFQRQFQRLNGTGLPGTVRFSMYTAAVSFFIILTLNGFRLKITGFSAALGAVYAINNLLYAYASLKALSTANLSVFSIYAMLGGMLLPFLCGVLFYNETLTWMKAAAAV